MVVHRPIISLRQLCPEVAVRIQADCSPTGEDVRPGCCQRCCQNEEGAPSGAFFIAGIPAIQNQTGGEAGIRTLDEPKPITVFETEPTRLRPSADGHTRRVFET